MRTLLAFVLGCALLLLQGAAGAAPAHRLPAPMPATALAPAAPPAPAAHPCAADSARDHGAHAGGSCTHCSLCHSALAPPILALPLTPPATALAREDRSRYTSAPRARLSRPPIA